MTLTPFAKALWSCRAAVAGGPMRLRKGTLGARACDQQSDSWREPLPGHIEQPTLTSFTLWPCRAAWASQLGFEKLTSLIHVRIRRVFAIDDGFGVLSLSLALRARLFSLGLSQFTAPMTTVRVLSHSSRLPGSCFASFIRSPFTFDFLRDE